MLYCLRKRTGLEMEGSWRGMQGSEYYSGIPQGRGRMRAMENEDDKLAEFHASAFNQ